MINERTGYTVVRDAAVAMGNAACTRSSSLRTVSKETLPISRELSSGGGASYYRVVGV